MGMDSYRAHEMNEGNLTMSRKGVAIILQALHACMQR